MTVGEFAEQAALLRRAYGASEESGGRTDAYEASLHGGMVNGPHGWDRARDWIYDTHTHAVPNRPGSESHPRSPHSCPICSTTEIKLIHEPTHDHIQPASFPAGPVTEYNGETKDWS